MRAFDWLGLRFGRQESATSLFERGAARERKHNHQGAIDDYTAIIGMTNAPSDLIAMAFYNRALVRVAGGDEPNGVHDFGMVLAMDEALVNVKTMARHWLAGMESPPSENKV